MTGPDFSPVTEPGRIDLPAGEFFLSRPWEIRASHVRIRGQGRATALRLPPGVSIAVTGSDVQIADLLCVGAEPMTPAADSYGVLAVGGRTAPLEGLWIERVGMVGMSRGGVYAKDCDGVRIRDCWIDGWWLYGVALVCCQGAWVEDCRVEDCLARTVGQNAYGICATSYSGGRQSRDVLIAGNRVRNVPTWTGIDGHYAANLVVRDNVVEGCYTAIEVQSRETEPHQVGGLVIAGNRLRARQIDGEDRGQGITLWGYPANPIRSAAVLGNVAEGFGWKPYVNRGAIRGRDCDSVLVVGNHWRDCGEWPGWWQRCHVETAANHVLPDPPPQVYRAEAAVLEESEGRLAVLPPTF